MQAAVPVGEGAMAALLGLELAEAQGARRGGREGEVCQVANDNAPGQVVISGARAAVERAVEIAPDNRRQARHAAAGVRALPLRADAARRRSHGARRWPGRRSRRRSCRWSPMCWRRRSAIRPRSARRLVEQVTGTVRWRESDGVSWRPTASTTFYEVGAGKVLTGLRQAHRRDVDTRRRRHAGRGRGGRRRRCRPA